MLDFCFRSPSVRSFHILPSLCRSKKLLLLFEGRGVINQSALRRSLLKYIKPRTSNAPIAVCQLLIVFIHLYSNNTGPTHRLYLPWQEILPARFEHDQRQPFLLAYMLALLPTSQSGFLFSYSFYIATALTSQKHATDLHVLKKKELRTAHTPGDRRPLY